MLAGGEEHDAFVLLVALQEGEEGVKLLLNLHLHVVVKQLNRGDGLELLGQGAVLCGVVVCP